MSLYALHDRYCHVAAERHGVKPIRLAFDYPPYGSTQSPSAD